MVWIVRCCLCCFFFKQKTAYEMRISDWSSDVCSSDLDFSDEDDVPDDGIETRIGQGVRILAEDVRAVLASPSAERLRDGVRVVLAGPPNAGKSTLLNRLVGRDAAIVSDVAGTTRDRIEVPAALGGTAFLFTDPAGLRGETDDAGDEIGIDRARRALEAADIIQIGRAHV